MIKFYNSINLNGKPITRHSNIGLVTDGIPYNTTEIENFLNRFDAAFYPGKKISFNDIGDFTYPNREKEPVYCETTFPHKKIGFGNNGNFDIIDRFKENYYYSDIDNITRYLTY
ncbi:MAG: hypothetical protein BTN85_0703 [Candidatus Methanohalarchaeum thermophilum]|uniref:Uncharacterized protein n=1 Tax=Methanohalarchaeum thermophilum TaxID=1903181 RepID=A0A1Q6DV54_METT1|nr:MAG: hypothetical protein BTN85_0703 [Candidatus Methanohalarchaeum thermophilum]